MPPVIGYATEEGYCCAHLGIPYATLPCGYAERTAERRELVSASVVCIGVCLPNGLEWLEREQLV